MKRNKVEIAESKENQAWLEGNDHEWYSPPWKRRHYKDSKLGKGKVGHARKAMSKGLGEHDHLFREDVGPLSKKVTIRALRHMERDAVMESILEAEQAEAHHEETLSHVPVSIPSSKEA